MNISLIIANILAGLAFIVHTYMGDQEVRQLEPQESVGKKRGIWTMLRCGWHWISLDLLLASVLLGGVNFGFIEQNQAVYLNLLSFYFLGYAVVWLLTIMISRSFPKNYLMLGQWMLLGGIGGLIWWAAL